MDTTTTIESIVLGGGCFWCVEAAFELVSGIVSVQSGYSGGETVNPTYHKVCTQATGHAEVVKIIFDPEIVTLSRLLEVFWQIHNPTTLNQQGHDTGTQYRSVIFYTNPLQLPIINQSVETLSKSGVYNSPIVTYIQPLKEFYAAEDEHQHYFVKHLDQAYCQRVIKPKVEKLQKYLAQE